MSIRRLSFLLVGFALLVSGLPAAAEPFPGVDAKWRHYQSANFELYSRNSESESRDLLHNLELVRAVFFENFKLKPRRAVPMTVFFFSRDKYFDAYLPSPSRELDNIAAFYHSDLDRGTLLMAPTPSFEAAQQLAFGCYTYHLFSLIDERPPLWYVRGMSGIFRNLELHSSYIGFGKPDAGQIRRLQQSSLLPADSLLFADSASPLYSSNRTHQVFVDQSWALLHYLYFGQHKIPREQVERFIAFVLARSKDAGTAQLREAAGATLGLDFAQLNRALDGYARNGRYGWSKLAVPKVAAAKSFSQRPVPLAEIRLRLAELASRMNDSPMGKLTLLHAADDPAAEPRLHEALGASDYRAGNVDVAEERWSRAFARGTDNPAIFHELSMLEGRRKFQRFDLNYLLPEEAADRLRELLHRSIKAVPDQTTGYEMLAWVEATSKSPSIANINLVQSRFQDLRNKPRTLLALAVVRLRVDDRATALSMLDTLDKMQPDVATAYGAEITRARLEDRPVNRQKLPPATEGTRFRFDPPKLELPR